MSLKQHNSKKPFCIRNYAFESRQKNIAQSWPFHQKYLKLFLNNGVNDILPPLGRATPMDEDEKIFKRQEEYALLENPVSHLCGELARLSLSLDGDHSINVDHNVSPKQNLMTTLDPLTTGNQSSFFENGNQSSKPHNSSKKNICNMEVNIKGRAKTKSMSEILAVAKHCVLDRHGRNRAASGSSSSSKAQNLEVQKERNVKDKASGPGLKVPDSPKLKDSSWMKKHHRHDDSATGTGQLSKRSCTTEVSSYRYKDCKLKPWGRNNLFKSAETEKSGRCERKARQTASSMSVMKLQDRHAY